jgi:hypothetical protein
MAVADHEGDRTRDESDHRHDDPCGPREPSEDDARDDVADQPNGQQHCQGRTLLQAALGEAGPHVAVVVEHCVLEVRDASLVVVDGLDERLDAAGVVPAQPAGLVVVRSRRRGCGDGSDVWGRVFVNDDRLPDDGRSGLRRESGSRSRLGRVTDLLLGGDDVVDVAGGAGRGRGLDDRPTGSRDVASLDEAGDDVPDVLLDGRFDGVERVPGRLDGGAGVRDGVGDCHLVSPVVWAGPGGPL